MTMTMTEIVGIEIGTTHEIITKETNHGMTMKGTDPIAGRDYMIETVHTVKTNHRITMIQIDPMTVMIHIVEIEHVTEINHTIEIGHIVEIDHETTTSMTLEMTTEMTIEGVEKPRNIKEGMRVIMMKYQKTLLMER